MKRTALALAIGLMTLLLGAVGSVLVATPRAQQLPIVATGRYQIVMSTLSHADMFLLDTQTGRTWRQVQAFDFEGEPLVWEFDERIDTPAASLAWEQTHKRKAK